MVFFGKVPLIPPDPIFGLTTAFQADPREQKVNLGVGIYKNDDLATPVLSSVKQAEADLLKDEMSKEYLPIQGDQRFIDQVGRLVFGADLWGAESKRVAGFQTPGGAAALCIGGAFLKKEIGSSLFLPDPTWPNHQNIFKALGFDVGGYPYYDFEHHRVSFERMLSYCHGLPSQSVIVLHASCHNPTGLDPSAQQWDELAELCVKKQLLPFFDCAYQGLGKGLDHDAASIRIFAKKQIEMLVAVSQSKNFSLYGERVGALYIAAQSSQAATHVASRVKQLIRAYYSNPPMHGAKIVARILQDPSLKVLWEQELEGMRKRIQAMRECFVEALAHHACNRDLSYMKLGSGMFCFTGLTQLQVERARQEFGIYMTSDGRMNLCGLNSGNLEYVVRSLAVIIQ